MLLGELLTEEMSSTTALSRFGISFDQFSKMTPDQLRSRWRELIKAAHPDRPENAGKGDIAAEINAAYDVLKAYNSNSSRNDDPINANSHYDPLKPQPFRRSTDTYQVPPWQTDKQSTNNKITVENYRDKNYFKKHIWEISKNSNEEFTITAFGNNNMFEGQINVYGSRTVFSEMIHAMLIYNANGNKLSVTRAVLIKPVGENKSYLVYADGRDLSKTPIPLEFSENQKRGIEQKMPLILDNIKQMYNKATA